VIEEETGAPLEIQIPSPHDVTRTPQAGAAAPRQGSGRVEPESKGPAAGGAGSEARLIARDDRKNPLISTFDWTNDAVQRIFRVPAGFMRSQTQERIEELARERAAAAIDLTLVEEGIEIGKRMMAEMIASYPSQGKNPAAGTSAQVPAGLSAAPGAPAPEVPAAPRDAGAAPRPAAPAGGGYLNEVSSLSANPRQG
jgi:hypothetical protein